MAMTSPARQLYVSRHFKEAVEAYRRQLREGPGSEWANMDGLADALMGAGEFAEAIPFLEKVSEHEHGLLPGNLGREIPLSVCHWMIGERQRALAIIKDLVIAVRDGKIHYADLAGGVTQGLILCYMASTLDLSADVDLAMRFMQKLATRRSRIENWPGPAALFLLGGLTFGEAVRDATGSTDVAEARKIAERDGGMKRRYLTNILFAAGTERRIAGEEAGCRLFMTECAGLTNPLVEDAWYLARGEVAASS